MRVPLDYPAKQGYQTTEKAEIYARRSFKRHVAEKKVLAKILNEILSIETQKDLLALDVPSGTGRMSLYLQECGFRVLEADISHAMLMQGRKTGKVSGLGVVADLEEGLPFSDNTFDLVLTWRFLHHLPSIASLTKVLQEIARISRKWIVFSFFHPVSFHNATRKLQGVITGKKACRYAYSLDCMDAACREGGFVFWRKSAQLPYFKDLWAAAYQKRDMLSEKKQKLGCDIIPTPCVQNGNNLERKP